MLIQRFFCQNIFQLFNVKNKETIEYSLVEWLHSVQCQDIICYKVSVKSLKIFHET